MSSLALLFLCIPIAFLILVLLFIYAYILVPLNNLSFYKKQGIKTVFFPVLGITKFRISDLRKKDDFLFEAKASSKVDPNEKLVATNMGKDVVLLLRDTDYMKEFLQNQSHFKKAQIFNLYRKMLGRGLILLEGDEWKLHRRIISSCFHYDFIKNNMHLIQETSREILDSIPPEEFKECLVMDKVQAITGEVVGRMFFGRNLSRYTFESEPLTTVLGRIMSTLGEFITSPAYMLFNMGAFKLPIPKFKSLIKRIEDFRAVCFRIVQDRKKENQRYNDLLDALLAHQNQKTANEEGFLTDQDIVDEFITFFVAGMDTTGHLVTMMLYNLIQHPEHYDRLKKERDETYNKTKEADADTVQNMDVLNCFLKETLRHHTPAPAVFLRETKEDCTIKDLQIKKGTIVRIDPFAAFFNEKYFDEPEKFNPDRWQNTQKLNSFAFIPFSAGPRNCIGQHLALLEAKVIVCEFLERFKCQVSEGYKLKMIFRFLYEPYENMKMDLTKIEGK